MQKPLCNHTVCLYVYCMYWLCVLWHTSMNTPLLRVDISDSHTQSPLLVQYNEGSLY
jgi:hypothetical protein